MKRCNDTPRVFRYLPAIVLALAGCDQADELDDRARSGIYYDCSNWRCGYNSSEINGKSLQDLHLGGQPNADGVALVGLLPPLGLLLGWQLDVDGDELIARGGLLGNSILRGPALLGATLLVQIDQGLVVPVIIAGYQQVDSWASNGAPVHAYALVYADLDQPLLQRSICKGTLLDPLQASVVVLAGERYDLDDKTVIEDQPGWITLACAGSAAAKMALLGYGPHAEFTDGAPPPSAASRQATLKMITADYCGDGHSYTTDGMPLAWENQSGTVLLEPEAGAREAIWTDGGARCLDTPRLVERDEVGCSLPSCDAFTLDDGEWLSHAIDGG
ncbi:MAG TPA: ADYC domain-containing protein [Enhygromyxa sp.]|nr:ADYC domain-containing protein [Enhygromyxa sp.]